MIDFIEILFTHYFTFKTKQSYVSDLLFLSNIHQIHFKTNTYISLNIAIKYNRFRLGSSKIVILRNFMYFLTKSILSTQVDRKIMFVIFFVLLIFSTCGPRSQPPFLTQSFKKTDFVYSNFKPQSKLNGKDHQKINQ